MQFFNKIRTIDNEIVHHTVLVSSLYSSYVYSTLSAFFVVILHFCLLHSSLCLSCCCVLLVNKNGVTIISYTYRYSWPNWHHLILCFITGKV